MFQSYGRGGFCPSEENRVSPAARRFMDTSDTPFIRTRPKEHTMSCLHSPLWCNSSIFSEEVFLHPPLSLGRLNCSPFWASGAFVCFLCYSKDILSCQYLTHFWITRSQHCIWSIVGALKRTKRKYSKYRGIYLQLFHNSEIELRGAKEILIIATQID